MSVYDLDVGGVIVRASNRGDRRARGGLPASTARRYVRPTPLVSLLLALACATSSAAAQGWYLMAPPFSSFEDSSKTGGLRILDDAPLGQWSRIGSFDNAEACEQS